MSPPGHPTSADRSAEREGSSNSLPGDIAAAGQIALVTGASRGIGRAIAMALAA